MPKRTLYKNIPLQQKEKRMERAICTFSQLTIPTLKQQSINSSLGRDLLECGGINAGRALMTRMKQVPHKWSPKCQKGWGSSAQLFQANSSTVKPFYSEEHLGTVETAAHCSVSQSWASHKPYPKELSSLPEVKKWGFLCTTNIVDCSWMFLRINTCLFLWVYTCTWAVIETDWWLGLHQTLYCTKLCIWIILSIPPPNKQPTNAHIQDSCLE